MSIKDNYSIQGFFYANSKWLFRKQLEIKKKGTNLLVPDLMVIMMNPGGSKPMDKNNDGQILTDTYPDKTQKQIMQVMEICNFEFARVLNLSDLRETTSSVFYKKLKDLEEGHSIFHDSRKSDFCELFVTNVPVIYAWGVNKVLKPLADLAIKKTKKDSLTFGIQKENEEFAFYHPLPRKHVKQKEWVDNIIIQIKKG